MYGIDEKTQESNVGSTINAGIQDNIKLQGVDFEPLVEGNDPVIKVNFIDEFGATLQEVLWEVDEARVREYNQGSDKKHKRNNKELGFKKGEPVTDDDAVVKAYELFNQRAKHIATKFIPEDTIVEALKGAGSYAEFGQAYADLFTPSRTENVRVRLKVVLNNKDYSTLPKYPPFIESMDVPEEKSQLELTEYDRVTKATSQDADDPMSAAASEGAGIPDDSTF